MPSGDNQPKKPIPPGLHGGDRRSAGYMSFENENLKAFVADIAVKTGKGRSTVARDVTRAKKVAVLDDIAGTCLDKSICICPCISVGAATSRSRRRRDDSRRG